MVNSIWEIARLRISMWIRVYRVDHIQNIATCVAHIEGEGFCERVREREKTIPSTFWCAGAHVTFIAVLNSYMLHLNHHHYYYYSHYMHEWKSLLMKIRRTRRSRCCCCCCCCRHRSFLSACREWFFLLTCSITFAVCLSVCLLLLLLILLSVSPPVYLLLNVSFHPFSVEK